MINSESHKNRSDDFGDPEAVSVCRWCEQPMRPRRGSRGFCGDQCRFYSKVQKGPGCWLWTGALHRSGNPANLPYGQFYYKGRPRRAHIVAFALKHGYIPKDEVMHSCNTPLCVRDEHLSEGTRKENMEYAAKCGRLRVARPRRQKVTAEQIQEMRGLATSGMLHVDIAARFGIARNTVSDIVAGRSRRYDAPLTVQLEQAG